MMFRCISRHFREFQRSFRGLHRLLGDISVSFREGFIGVSEGFLRVLGGFADFQVSFKGVLEALIRDSRHIPVLGKVKESLRRWRGATEGNGILREFQTVSECLQGFRGLNDNSRRPGTFMKTHKSAPLKTSENPETPKIP